MRSKVALSSPTVGASLVVGGGDAGWRVSLSAVTHCRIPGLDEGPQASSTLTAYQFVSGFLA
jgi:hypothetical protein